MNILKKIHFLFLLISTPPQFSAAYLAEEFGCCTGASSSMCLTAQRPILSLRFFSSIAVYMPSLCLTSSKTNINEMFISFQSKIWRWQESIPQSSSHLERTCTSLSAKASVTRWLEEGGYMGFFYSRYYSLEHLQICAVFVEVKSVVIEFKSQVENLLIALLPQLVTFLHLMYLWKLWWLYYPLFTSNYIYH